jgi:uncharacterized protein
VAQAIAFYKRACDGHLEPLACTELGIRHAGGDGVELDVVLAAHHYLSTACGKGHAPACTQAGLLFEHSTDLGVNYARAAGQYEQGCAGGDAASCFHLATLYLEGRGRDQDPVRARALYEEACRRGMRQVCGLVARWRAPTAGS